MTASGKIDWASIGRALLHPTQAQILEELAKQYGVKGGKPLSASDIHKTIESDSLARVSYHCKALLGRKWIKKAGRQRVRGATEQFYELVPGNIKPVPPKRSRRKTKA